MPTRLLEIVPNIFLISNTFFSIEIKASRSSLQAILIKVAKHLKFRSHLTFRCIFTDQARVKGYTNVSNNNDRRFLVYSHSVPYKLIKDLI